MVEIRGVIESVSASEGIMIFIQEPTGAFTTGNLVLNLDRKAYFDLRKHLKVLPQETQQKLIYEGIKNALIGKTITITIK